MTITVVLLLNGTVIVVYAQCRETVRKALLVSASSFVFFLSFFPSYDFYLNSCAGNIYLGEFFFFPRTGSVCLFLANSDEEPSCCRVLYRTPTSSSTGTVLEYTLLQFKCRQASKQVQGIR